MKKISVKKTISEGKQASTILMEALVKRVGEAKAKRLIKQARIDLQKEIEQYAKKRRSRSQKTKKP